MRKIILGKHLAAVALVWTMVMMPLAAIGQTRISMPKNKYKVQDDVKAGRDAARQVEQQMPILNDAEATRYLAQVGERLVRTIPPEFRQPSFDYTFKIVNARDINAFALPGGPMFVNRGMIEAAAREGEMAGVMAHEIAHVALRHGTAGATKAQNPTAQLPAIGGAILGAILGGTLGGIAQTAGQIGSGAIITSYSREYETQADILGAQIMANAGYDPRDLANMFRTIERESGGGSRGPVWLSSHPNPGNRYENINREAQLLRVNNPVGNTAQFERIQSKLKRMPRAQSMAEIGQNAPTNPNGQGSQSPIANGRYSTRVAVPSTRTKAISSSSAIQMNIPNNWQEFPNDSELWIAPAGAYGDQGITHGALVGTTRPQSNNLAQASQQYVESLLQSNDYLSQRSNAARTTVSGRTAYAAVLSGRSPVTNRTEVTTVYTTQLRNGDLFYVITVAPENESSSYNSAFRNMIGSIRLND
ncbi:MAG: M48 family metallopeptidase [Pyrinomonadaceae bacterium]|nr:M48 family metallopeptidase [Pyrinomonadaceae bacterium]